MAARLTEEQREKLAADYKALGSYRAAAEKNGVAAKTVKRAVLAAGQAEEPARKKPVPAEKRPAERGEPGDGDLLSFMESKKGVLCEIIDNGLEALRSPEKLAEASASQITRTLDTLINSFAAGCREPVPEQEGGPFLLPAELLGRAYVDVNRDISQGKHTEYLFKGGRGSLKSSFISLKIIELLKNDRQLNAVVLRKVGNTLERSVFNQLVWAIGALGLEEEFRVRRSPLQLQLKATGQTIYFSGLDDPLKLKSIKPKTGYIGILWFEELDQFAGPEELRSVRQSVIRGGDRAYVFLSFNPPKTRGNWANEEAEQPKEQRLTLHTDYRSAPAEWLGEAFLSEAEYVRQVNPKAYEHEYLGIANGNGGTVFENLAAEPIPDEQIARFERSLCGVDWGYYPDPWAFNRVCYDPARRVLYVYQELTAYKKGNRETAELLRQAGVGAEELITADSAEPKSVADYRSFGFNCRGARKGPGSLDYSMKWLQSLARIVVDPGRCPETLREFARYEYERTRDGRILSGYPDRENHHIDAVRYATEEIWKWMGE